MKLTRKEKKEQVFITIGRLEAAISMEEDIPRQLALLTKIAVDVSDMDIKIMHLGGEEPYEIKK